MKTMSKMPEWMEKQLLDLGVLGSNTQTRIPKDKDVYLELETFKTPRFDENGEPDF